MNQKTRLEAAQAAVQNLRPAELSEFHRWLNGRMSQSKPVVAMTNEELARLALSRPEKAKSQTLSAIYEAWKRGPDHLENVLSKLRYGGMDPGQIKNFKYVATNVIPFMVQYELYADPYVVAQVIAAMRGRGRNGTVRTGKQAKALFELLGNPETSPQVSMGHAERVRAENA